MLYEVKALRSGLLKVYNQPWADGLGEEAIAFDYAPWFFGGFGAAYGLAIGILEYTVNLRGMPNATETFAYVMTALILCIAGLAARGLVAQLRVGGHNKKVVK